MNAYAARQGKTLDSLRFLYDGERISPNDTPHAVCFPGLGNQLIVLA